MARPSGEFVTVRVTNSHENRWFVLSREYKPESTNWNLGWLVVAVV